MPPSEGDLIEFDAPRLFDAIGLERPSFRARVVYVKSIGLGYSRVGACFIGLGADEKDALRVFLDSLEKERKDT